VPDPDPLTELAYGMFAMHQDLPTADLTPMEDQPHLVAPRHQSPEWFAAAAGPDASLLDMAPELLAMPPESQPADASTSVRPDADIIAIYAPETSGEYRRRARLAETADAPQPSVAEPVRPVPDEDGQHPRTAVQMGLLRELADLDP